MDLIMEQLEKAGLAVLIMACATGGTVGLLKLIRHFSPNGELPKDPISKKLEEERDKK